MKPSIFKIFVETYYQQANKTNQNRTKRTNEVRRIIEQVEASHGKIPRSGMLIRKLPANLFHVYDPKRDSFGYKETTEKLKKTINEAMGRPVI